MTALALNMLALLIVLGLCWGAMMWLSGRFHGHGATHTRFDVVEYQDDEHVDRGSAAPRPTDAPCTVCEGVGALTTQGKLAPCPECYGTGVLT